MMLMVLSGAKTIEMLMLMKVKEGNHRLAQTQTQTRRLELLHSYVGCEKHTLSINPNIYQLTPNLKLNINQIFNHT